MFNKIYQYFDNIQPALSEDAWAYFTRCLVIKKYRRGELISKIGYPNKWVSFVQEGAILVFNYNNEGKKVVYEFVFDGQYTGDYESFLTSKAANYALEALEDSTLYNLHYDNLQKIYSKYPEFERIGRLIAEAQFLRVTERNARLLGENPQDRYETLINERKDVLQRVPQYYVASYLGITPEALSRIRRRMTQR